MDKGAMANNIGIGEMLLRWKGSVFKVVYKELLVFLFFFAIISAVYRTALNQDQKKWNFNLSLEIEQEGSTTNIFFF